MTKLRIFRFLLLVVFCVGFLGNVSFAIGVCRGSARGGVGGVTAWIEHVTYEGKEPVTVISPGAIRFSEPIIKHIYLRFALNWIFLVALTLACFCRRKSCAQRMAALEARHNQGP
jgi:hypothetical protein